MPISQRNHRPELEAPPCTEAVAPSTTSSSVAQTRKTSLSINPCGSRPSTWRRSTGHSRRAKLYRGIGISFRIAAWSFLSPNCCVRMHCYRHGDLCKGSSRQTGRARRLPVKSHMSLRRAVTRQEKLLPLSDEPNWEATTIGPLRRRLGPGCSEQLRTDP
jgi:hypothetical protein